jgi:S1-C subfamily serine protease
MNRIDLTPQLKEQRRFALRRQFNTIAIVYAIVCLLPFLIYGLYAWGVLKSTKKGEFEDMEKATALVFVQSSGKTGSAFLVSEDRLLTARHVVDDLQPGETVLLRFEKLSPVLEITATVEWIAETSSEKGALEYFLTDVAVLKITDPSILADKGLIPISLGSSTGVGTLTKVVAIGYPSGDYSIKRGDINSDTYNGLDLFKVDPATNPGDSGGPLISESDRSVIGIMVGGLEGAQGENVAVKIDNVIGLLEKGGIIVN